MAEHRPNPDKLLVQAQAEERQENRGKLKIYLGAAPGVGKTHEMLHDALEEHSKGLDVVVGVAESHGRQEIADQLKNFEILPRKPVEYHGTTLLEFDLDAALKRYPALILMDEMAHTNAPESRHKKRWQDIKELLDRGIDVATTLNVQHIESLNDDVAQIIHAPINETVPDSMIEMADTIELVDLPPEELIKRLQEGKVYIPEQAALASEQFFRKGNLIALRELALRVTAERVSAQVLLYRQGQGIKRIWPTREKILVCVGPGQESLKLIRTAKRLAIKLQAEWMAAYIDTPRIHGSEERRNLATQHLRLAEQLGAETRILTGLNIVDELMNFAYEQNITQIMLWKHVRPRWQAIFFRSLADEIIRQSGEIHVYIMSGAPETSVAHKSPKKIVKKTTPWKAYALALLMVGLATFFDTFFYTNLTASSSVLAYILALTVVGLSGQMGAALFASAISAVIYDYFFIPPYYSLAIIDKDSIFILLVLLTVSQVICYFKMLTFRQAESSRRSEHQTAALYILSRQLARTRGSDKLLEVGIKYIATIFECEVLGLIPKSGHLVIRARCNTNQELDEKERGVAQWVYELGQVAGLGTDSLSFSEALYLPLLGKQGVIGVLRIKPLHPHVDFNDQMHLLEAAANQIALALEVDRLQEQRKKSELQMETDQARSALLRSVSHDFRTPIKTILAAANQQIESAESLDSKVVKKIGKDIYLEAEQLSRLINNLLRMTHFEVEQVILKKEFLSLIDLIETLLKKSAKKLARRPIQTHYPQNLPLILFDGALIQEVLVNLIDNSVKFTPPKSPIEISVCLETTRVVVSVLDHGPGIMQDEVHQLFDKFYRGRMLREERGLGLGLAISRSIIKAHGGEIWAENEKDLGAVFRFSLPL